ncbi:MAG: NAD-dependent epimerase/dehydratase family protein [Pseudomonadota bacterium]
MGDEAQSRPASRCAVLFGGTGFIGGFFARFLVDNGHFAKVYLIDRTPVTEIANPWRRAQLTNHPALSVVIADVREPIDWMPPEPVTLVANFAAVHREPGHQPREYYDTNLRGAEQVCAWAARAGCRRMIFTSSISLYGAGPETRDESSLPVPATPYGGSKLAAEYIHRLWQAAQPSRRLVIARPGVVFGPGEEGNVTRLVRAVLGGWFCYFGNRAVRKAGIYVRELCDALWWALERPARADEPVALFNASLSPVPTLGDYVEAIQVVAGRRRWVPELPGGAVLAAGRLLDLAARPLGIEHPFSPVRLRKLIAANDIAPAWLLAQGYPFRYTLTRALADWRALCPQEWADP